MTMFVQVVDYTTSIRSYTGVFFRYYTQFSTQCSEIASWRMNISFFIAFQAPPSALAKQVLAEVPDQVCRYYQLLNIPPNVPAPLQPGSAPAGGPGFFAQFTGNATS
jgi:hypothetical protein